MNERADPLGKARLVMSWHGRREKFDDLDLELWNAHHKALKTRFEADNAATPENLDAAMAAEKAHAEKCREFRKWCAQQRDSIPRELDDVTKEFSETDRAEGQKLHEKIVKRFAELEAACPTGDDPPPPPIPIVRARRTLL